MMCTLRLIVQLCLLLIVLTGLSNARKESTPLEDKLLEDLVEKGGLVKFEVGRECPTCLRGALATQTIEKGELLLAVPVDTVAMRLKSFPGDRFPAEYAYYMINDMMRKPDFNETHKLFLATLPPPGELLTAETATDEELQLSESEKFMKMVLISRTVTDSIYKGTLKWQYYMPMEEFLGDKAPSLEYFRHMSGIVGSRDFALRGQDEQGNKPYYMVPVADLVNHAYKPNAYRTDNGTHLVMYSLRRIKKGEEITNDYQQDVLHRNDMTLCIYGFLLNLPFLAATDLPTYSENSPYGKTPPTDAGFYGPGGSHNTEEELERLQGLLDEMTTTEEQDEALIKRSESVGTIWETVRCNLLKPILGECLPVHTWRELMFIKFRLHRKKMLKKAMRTIRQELTRQKDIADEIVRATQGRGGHLEF